MVRTRAGWRWASPRAPAQARLEGPSHPFILGSPRNTLTEVGIGPSWAAQQPVCRRAWEAGWTGRGAPGPREQPSAGPVLFRCCQEHREHDPQPAQGHGTRNAGLTAQPGPG